MGNVCRFVWVCPSSYRCSNISVCFHFKCHYFVLSSTSPFVCSSGCLPNCFYFSLDLFLSHSLSLSLSLSFSLDLSLTLSLFPPPQKKKKKYNFLHKKVFTTNARAVVTKTKLNSIHFRSFHLGYISAKFCPSICPVCFRIS